MTIGIVTLLDQGSKFYIVGKMSLHESVEVIKDFFHITYVRNRGAAFGILSNMDDTIRIPFFLISTIVALVAIVIIYLRAPERNCILHLSLALILGGALNNLIDRIFYGEVIDFLDLHWYQYHWPAFNVADSAITIGAIGLLIGITRKSPD